MTEKTPLTRIADRKIPFPELLRAIAELGAVTEEPSFWTAIADNPGYRPDHRRHAIVQLFRRHVRPGMTLSELAAVLGHPGWLRAEDIAVVTELAGKIPVRMTLEDTVFVLQLLPDLSNGRSWAIYLRVSGKLDRGAVLGVLLLSDSSDPTAENTHLLEVGFSIGA